MRRASAIAAIAGLVLISATGGAATPPSDRGGESGDLSTAERQILEACLADSGTNPAACGCYLETLRRLLPETDYALATGLAAAAMRGDGEAFRRLVTRHRLSADRLQTILTATDRALRTAEQRCEQTAPGAPQNR